MRDRKYRTVVCDRYPSHFSEVGTHHDEYSLIFQLVTQSVTDQMNITSFLMEIVGADLLITSRGLTV